MNAALLALFLVTSPAMQGPPMSGSAGFIESSRDFKHEIREGNTVVATQFFKLKYEVTYSVDPTDETELSHGFYCQRECQGKVHTQHSECDYSCDKACGWGSHKHTMRGRYVEHPDEMRRAEREADQGAVECGGTTDSRDWTQEVSQLRRAFREMARKPKEVKVDHFAGPCSFARKLYQYRKHDWKIKGTFTRSGYTMSRGVKTPLQTVAIFGHSATIAEMWLPEESPYFEDGWVECYCKQQSQTAMMPNEMQIMAGGFFFQEPRTSCPSTATPKGIVAMCTGQDLFNAFCTVENKTDKPCKGTLLPGTLLIPEDGGTQIEVVTQSADISVLGALPEALKMLGGAHIVIEPGDKVAIPVRVLCTEMGKRAPTKATKFRVAQAKDMVVSRLANIAGTSNIKGPWDQARLWIYTDKASMADINKRLTPGVNAGFYLNGLWDVAQRGGVDVSDKAYKGCTDPQLLLNTTSRPQAAEWFVSFLAQTDPKGLATFINKNLGTFSANLAGSHDNIDLRHYSGLASSLLGNSDKGVRMSGLAFLLKGIPADQRAEMIRRGALDGVRDALRSKDKEEAVVALEVVAAYEFGDAKMIVADLGENAVDESVKRKAADTLKGLGGAAPDSRTRGR